VDKLSIDFQKQFSDKLIFDRSILDRIDPTAKLHDEALRHPLSSAGACLNVLGSLGSDKEGLKAYLNSFGFGITKVFDFPTGADVGGQVYNDRACVVFEWIGPRESPINERGGGRGLNKTSIDAYVIAEIDGKVTQLLIEWKFTEGSSRPIALNKFAGLRGIERIRRYSSVLSEMRGHDFPFAFTEEGGLSIQDFSSDHFYQLMRMTLLARKTTPLDVGPIHIEDYRIAHLAHSGNPKINTIQPEYAKYCPGLQGMIGKNFHEVWATLLALDERRKFIAGYWDHGISAIKNLELRDYLQVRYA
jgi:hypothetical protein